MIKKVISLIVIIVIGLAIFCVFEISAPASSASGRVKFTVAPGESATSVVKRLKQENLINNESIFLWYARFKGQENFMAGEHQLARNANMKAMIGLLMSSSNINNEKTITIIEGWKLKDIGDYLAEQGFFSVDDFLAAAKIDRWQDKYDFLRGVKEADLEGFLFPDTYRVFDNSTADVIIKKMLDNFEHRIDSQRLDDIVKQKKSLLEIITLASIVEREVRSPVDKKMVADVFWKRISAGIALQSDATVNYLTGKKTTRPSGADLQIDSPYNTYKYRGLPPGPIGNPGLASIDAVIYPISNNYYYFITDNDGRAVYAKTYAEHLQNVQKYLR
ncbi:MAG: endolytic transglycosylase MltG [Patescibacteria group bacterium]